MAGELGKAIGLTHGVGRRTQDVGPSEAAVFKAFSAAGERDAAEKKQRQKDLEEIYKDINVEQQFKSPRIQSEWANESASAVSAVLDAYTNGDANSYIEAKKQIARLQNYRESAKATDEYMYRSRELVKKDPTKYGIYDEQTIDGNTYTDWMDAYEAGVPIDKLNEYYGSGELVINDNSKAYAERGIFPYVIDYRPTPMSDPYEMANKMIAAEDMIEERKVSTDRLPLSGDVVSVYKNFLPQQKVTDTSLAIGSDVGVNRKWIEDSYQRIKREKAAKGEPYTRAMFETDRDAVKGASLLGINSLEKFLASKQSPSRTTTDRPQRQTSEGGGKSWADNWALSTYVSDDGTVKGATMSPKSTTTTAARNISIPKGATILEAGSYDGKEKPITKTVDGIQSTPFGFEWDVKKKGLDGAMFKYSSEYNTENQKTGGMNVYRIPLNRESFSNFVSASRSTDEDVMQMIRSVSDQDQLKSIDDWYKGVVTEGKPKADKEATIPPAPSKGGSTSMITVVLNGKTGQIPSDKIDEFMKKYPNAQRK